MNDFKPSFVDWMALTDAYERRTRSFVTFLALSEKPISTSAFPCARLRAALMTLIISGYFKSYLLWGEAHCAHGIFSETLQENQ